MCGSHASCYCELTAWTQRRTKVSLWCMHCMYCGMPKGTSQDEATLNSEKIKPVALAVIKLHLPEDIRQAVSQ